MTVFFRPCGPLELAPTPRSDADIEMFEFISERTGLEIKINEEVDYEDWMEPVCMLNAALRKGLEVAILPYERLQRAVCNPVVTVPGEPCRDILIGRYAKNDPHFFQHFDFGWPVEGWTLASHYAELATFHRYAGRKTFVADMPGDPNMAKEDRPFNGGPTSTELGVAMANFRGESCIVKQVYPTKAFPLLTYDLPDTFEAKDGKDLFFDSVELHFARFEGDRAALLVQEYAPMTHETRFFVIDHKVVTAAACIENKTPQQNAGGPMNTEFEVLRNSGVIEDRPDIAEKLWAFAEQVAQDVSDEAHDLPNYVVDLAIGADGKPLIIEFNPAAQSGMYAINAPDLFEAIFDVAQLTPHREIVDWDRDEFVGDEEYSEPKVKNSFMSFLKDNPINGI